ncbi:MAG: hypothetical protein OQJ81_02335, partial [Melioribacteraceae bacterium]|nr:hypothetical protein [Melioribacteraceae bacterium]
KQKIKSKNDSLTYKFQVKLPLDVTIPVLLKDINEVFAIQPVEATSNEKKVYGVTELTLASGKFHKLSAEFKYDSELSREYSTIGFLINSDDVIQEEEIKKLKEFAIPVGIILPLENKSKDIAELIKLNKLDYFIELSDNADNVDFELDEDLGLDKLTSNIKSIISSFNSPKVFFINELESGFSASIANFIVEKFEKRERKVITSNSFFNLKGEDNSDLHSLVGFHLNKMKPKTSKIFRISINDLFEIQNTLSKFIKKGNRIDLPSHLFNF